MLIEIWKAKCLEFVLRHSKIFMVAGVLFCSMLFWLFKEASHLTYRDYKVSFQMLEKVESLGGKEGYALLQKVPFIEGRYRALVAQKLLREKCVGEALSLASPALEKAKKELPLHAMYGECSFSIEQGAYQEALENTVALKEKLLQEGEEGSLLFGFALLRVAFLQQKLHNQPGEKAAWEELEKYGQAYPEMESALLSGWKEGQYTLFDYIQKRKLSFQ